MSGLLVLGCDGVRAARRPAEDVFVAVSRKAPARGDDCSLERINGNCRLDLDGQFEVHATCPGAPPADQELARVFVCRRPGWEKELTRAACRAGADAMVYLYTWSDACFDEDLEGVTGFGRAEYRIYRTR